MHYLVLGLAFFFNNINLLLDIAQINIPFLSNTLSNAYTHLAQGQVNQAYVSLCIYYRKYYFTHCRVFQIQITTEKINIEIHSLDHTFSFQL